jgi:hypothetical protein
VEHGIDTGLISHKLIQDDAAVLVQQSPHESKVGDPSEGFWPLVQLPLTSYQGRSPHGTTGGAVGCEKVKW